MRTIQWVVLLSTLSAKALWASDKVDTYDYSIKQFIKELQQDISAKTKRQYLRIKLLTNTVIDAFPIRE